MWWRILIVIVIAFYLIIGLFVSGDNGFVAKNKKLVLGIALGLCGFIIGQGMYSSYVEEAAIKEEIEQCAELKNTIQQHLNNRDYKSALALIKANESKELRIGKTTWTQLQPEQYVDAFINAGVYDLALEVIQTKVERKSYQVSGAVTKIVLGFYKNGQIDEAYAVAESFKRPYNEPSYQDCYSPFKTLITKHVGDLCEKGNKRDALNLIEKKKSGFELSTEEIEFIVNGYTNGSIPDYQMSAMLMAICFKGMSVRERYDLTMSMKDSGDVLDLYKKTFYIGVYEMTVKQFVHLFN